jgi:tetratricopeptide (TPR) repeat protein
MEDVVAANPSVLVYRAGLTEAYLGAGHVLERLGRREEAARRFRRATETAEVMHAVDPRWLGGRNQLAQGLLHESRLLIRGNRLEEGVRLLRRAQALLEEMVRDHPKVVGYRFNLAFACRALGRAEEQSGRRAEALAAFDRARQFDESDTGKAFIYRYNQACDLALIARVAPPDRRESLIEQALMALRRAVAQGYRRHAEMSHDDDLSILHDRGEFGLLLLDLAFPDDPFGPGG